jgi:NAD(P)-dependent dehydrogenase (short-subunit alcohol dehydrogenase family)
MNDLREQIALVTGAGSSTGIGLASARALGRDGASLMLVSTTDRIHKRAAELEKEGSRCMLFSRTAGFLHHRSVDHRGWRKLITRRSSLEAVNSSALTFEKDYC